MKALDINSTRDLEDLCINTIYASLLTGKLSPRTQTFQITSCTSRDLSPSTIDYTGMISTLDKWSKQCDLVLAEIAGRIRDVKAAAADRKRADDEYEIQLENVKKTITNKRSSKSKAVTSQTVAEDFEPELMQDVEEQDVLSPRTAMALPTGSGGESPSGRKRKLVRTLKLHH